ncbi:MAG: hypothetical protein AB7V18_15630 [Pyrinomonadaceae bacterium]
MPSKRHRRRKRHITNVQINNYFERNVLLEGSTVEGSVNTGDQGFVFGGTSALFDEQFTALKSELSKSVFGELEKFREDFRAGYLVKGWDGVAALTQLESWPSLEAPLRSKILQVQASMLLGLRGKEAAGDANNLVDKASKLDPDFDRTAMDLQIKLFREEFVLADSFSLAASADVQFYTLLHLFNAQKYRQIDEIYSALPTDLNLGANVRRVFALNLLTLEKLEAASAEIEKAKAASPNWFGIRHTASMIAYHRSLSPLVRPSRFSKYPEVISLGMVKRDNESQKRLLSASEEFGLLAETHPESHVDRQSCELWMFACLANVFEKQEEAIELGTRLLEQDPSNVQLLNWFMYRGYEWDFERSLAAIANENPESPDHVQDALAIVMINLRIGRPSEAISESDRFKDAFTSGEINDLRHYWRGMAYLDLGQTKNATKEMASIVSSALKGSLKLSILAFEANSSGDSSEIVRYLRVGYDRDPNAATFSAYYEANAHALIDKDFVIAEAERFSESAQTAFAVELAASALSRLRRNDEALALSEKYVELFPNGELPPHILKLKIDVLRNKNISQAVAEGYRLAHVENTAETHSLIMDLQREKGDLSGVLSSAKDLLGRADAKPAQLIRAAHFAAFRDHDLAEQLLKKAIDQDPKESGLRSQAHSLAMKLGLEDLGRPLVEKMMADARKGVGPMKMMDLDEAVEVMKEQSAANSELDRQYATGEIPVHLWANRRNLALMTVYAGIGKHNRGVDDFQDRFRIMARHGSRPVQLADHIGSEFRLYLDTTSLLLANHLGILDDIERLEMPIVVSRHTIASLFDQRDRMMPIQRSHVGENLKIKKLVDDGRATIFEPAESPDDIKELFAKELVAEAEVPTDVDPEGIGQSDDGSGDGKTRISADIVKAKLGDRMTAILNAHRNDGFAAGFLPLADYSGLKKPKLEFPASLTDRLVNARAIVDALYEANRISEELHSQTVDKLGVEGKTRTEVLPELGSIVYFMPDVESVLAGVGILDEVCDSFDVRFDARSWNRAQADISRFSELEVQDKDLDALQSRLADGISSGRYELLPHSEQKTDDGRLGIDIAAVENLLTFPIKSGDLIVLDDRYLNRHSSRIDGETLVPIVTIPDVLMALRQRGRIEPSVYYRKLIELRQINYRYLPLTEEEILFHLEAGRIKDGVLTETKELRTLRQYQASCFLDGEFLQVAAAPQHSESAFIMQSIEAVLAAITELWRNEDLPVEIATARSNWLIENLYTGHSGAVTLRSADKVPVDDDLTRILLASDIHALLVRGVFISDLEPLNSERLRRKAYFAWVEDRILRQNAANLESALSEVAKMFESQILNVKGAEFPNETYAKFSGVMLGRLFLDLPEAIRERADLSDEIKTWLHIRVGDTVSAGDLNFEPDEYWPAIESAVQGSEGAAKLIDSDEVYTFKRHEDSSDISVAFPGIEIRSPDGKTVRTVHDISFCIFAADVARSEALHNLRHMFDCTNSEFEKIISELVAIEDPAERASRFFELRSRSVWDHYKEIESMFGPGALIPWSRLLPPDGEQIFRYYRIQDTAGDPFSSKWEAAVNRMLDDEGVGTTFSKCSKLPLPLSARVFDEFAKLPVKDRIELADRLIANGSASPTRLLHLVNLIARTSTDSEQLMGVAENLLDKLYSEEFRVEFEAFLSVLTFTAESLIESDPSDPAQSLFVSWTHASTLYQILRNIGNAPEQIVDSFGRRRGKNALKSIERPAEYRNDCASPVRLNPTNFLTHAATRLFGGIPVEVLERLTIPETIKRAALRVDQSGNEITSLVLNADPLLCSDHLSSLFGGDRFEALSSIGESIIFEHLRSANLQDLLSMSLKMLVENPKEFSPWLMVYMIAGDLPVSEELRDLERSAILAFEADNLELSEDMGPGYILLAVANRAVQSNLDPEVRSHMESQILKLQSILPAPESSDRAEQTHGLLVDAALTLSRELNSRSATKSFTSLLEALYLRDRGIKDSHGPLIDQMTADSDPHLSQFWWRLRHMLRANSGDL